MTDFHTTINTMIFIADAQRSEWSTAAAAVVQFSCTAAVVGNLRQIPMLYIAVDVECQNINIIADGKTLSVSSTILQAAVGYLFSRNIRWKQQHIQRIRVRALYCWGFWVNVLCSVGW